MPTTSPEAVDAPVDSAPPTILRRPGDRSVREPRLLTPTLRIRRAVALLVITCVVPGSAQIAAGDR